MHSVHGVYNISMLCMLSAEKGTYWVPTGIMAWKIAFIIKLSEINPFSVISSIFSVKKIIANESIIVYYRLKI